MKKKYKRFEHLYKDSDFSPFDFNYHTLIDNRFYKYRSGIEGDTPQLRAIRNLEIWFASPRDFNDPFDCLPASVYHTNKLREIMTSDVIKYCSRFDNKPDNVKIASMVESHLTSLPSIHADDSISVFCLSKSPVDQIMWAHYANNHTGYVLEYEFNLKDEARSNRWLFPLPVIYQNDRPCSSDYRDPLEYYLIKSEAWKHEQEHRIIRPNLTNHAESIQPKQLKSIIFGIRTDDDLKRTIENEVSIFNQNNGHKIKTYSAIESLSSYEIIIPRHDLFDGTQI